MEELLGTKLRALYQRRKGRDLFDLFKALTTSSELDKTAIVKCYREYMKFVVDAQPDQRLFLQNMEAKLMDSEFLGDTVALLRPSEVYDPAIAYELVKTELIEMI